MKIILKAIYQLKRMFQFCSCEIPLALPRKVFFPHYVGITISSLATFGKGVVIYSNVTIGGKKSNQSKFPRIGNNVTIFTNSSIIGNIKIGNNSVVGAGSVVLKDVPANVVVAGNPAKIIKRLK